MKTFKSFLKDRIDELQTVKLKAKGEQSFVDATYQAQIKDPGDLEKVGPEEEGPKTIKSGQGKRPADRLDNKQPFGEQDMKHPEDEKTDANKLQKYGTKKWLTKDYKNGKVKEEVSLDEADFTKQQTKMAHTIGKHFEKKNVGDKSKGGPYAVASAMVKDKPEAAQKAYKTIQSKTKNEEEQIALLKLFDELNEENQKFFLEKLENDFDTLLGFAIVMREDEE